MPTQITENRIAAVIAAYAAHPAGSIPTRAQWETLAALPADAAVALVNLFRFRRQAKYHDNRTTSISGHEAFGQYSAVSGDALTRAGGHFTMMATPAGTLIGADATWDMMVVGQYPSPDAVLTLFEDPAYQACFIHRTAALADQRVSICQV